MTDVMNETLHCIKTRRSCRKYLDQQIREEELQTVLEAATYAPTGHGHQSPKMVVVQDAALLKQLSLLNARIMETTRDPFYGAPTAVIVFADATSHTGLQDASLVMGTLMLAAHAAGLGSCWINRAKQMFELEEGMTIKEKWGLGDNYEGLGICILGYEAEGGTVPPKPRKADYIIRA